MPSILILDYFYLDNKAIKFCNWNKFLLHHWKI